MKRGRSNEIEERDIQIRRITSSSVDILSLPNDILMVILMALSFCEYNVLRLVSIGMKNIISTIVPSIAKAQSREILTNSSFFVALTQIAAKSIEFGYFSLADWYQEHSISYRGCGSEILPNYHHQRVSSFFYERALSRRDQNGIEWLEKNNYKINISEKRSERFFSIWYSATKGGVSKLDWLMRKIGLPQIPSIQNFANNMGKLCGETGDISIYNWLLVNMNDLIEFDYVLVGALKERHYDTMCWFVHNHIHNKIRISGHTCLIELASNGIVDGLNWLFDNEFISKNYRMFYFNPELFKFGCLGVTFDILYRHAFGNNQLECIKWVYDKSKSPLCLAMSTGNLTNISNTNIINWVHNQGMFPCPDTKNPCKNCELSGIEICKNLAGYGTLEQVKWVRKVVKCAWNRDTCLNAAKYQKNDTLKWVLEEGCPYHTEASIYVAQFGKLEILKWLHMNGYKISNKVYPFSLMNGDREIFEWAIKNKIPSDNINWEPYEVHVWNQVTKEKDNFLIINWLKENDFTIDFF